MCVDMRGREYWKIVVVTHYNPRDDFASGVVPPNLSDLIIQDLKFSFV